MSKPIQSFTAKFDALQFRERLLIIISTAVLLGFIWWNFYTISILQQSKKLEQQNIVLQHEIDTFEQTAAEIKKQIDSGVLSARQEKLESLQEEFDKVSALLEQKTSALIEPDEMFDLMRQLIFAESGLKLTEMKRKQVKPVFQPVAEGSEEQQPEIYRHVLQMSFEGRYPSILKYVQKLEKLEWKLIWDRVSLKTADYPVIRVNIEISTLSDSQHWVGL